MVVVDSRAVKTKAVAKKKRKKVGTSLLDQCAFFLSFILSWLFYLLPGSRWSVNPVWHCRPVAVLTALFLSRPKLSDWLQSRLQTLRLLPLLLLLWHNFSTHVHSVLSSFSFSPFPSLVSFPSVSAGRSVGRPPFSCPTVLDRWTHTRSARKRTKLFF